MGLCKEVSNEKEVLEVQGVGWVPSLGVHNAGKVGLANPVSPGESWEGVAGAPLGGGR